MKRLLCVAFFLWSVAPLSAIQTNLIDDVIRMSRSHVADETIIEFVQTSRERIAVSADDMIAMTNAGVSQAVINAVLAKATASADAASPAQTAEPAAAPGEPSSPPPAADQGGCLTFDPPISLGYPIYDPFYPPELWDPWWYLPRLDTRGGPPVTKGPADRSARPPAARGAADTSLRPPASNRPADSLRPPASSAPADSSLRPPVRTRPTADAPKERERQSTEAGPAHLLDRIGNRTSPSRAK